MIDLFAGVGGMSLGAARAGFEVKCAVELDDIAISSHEMNFPQAFHIKYDVSKLKGEELLRTLSLRKGEVDGVIGGPPCQGFSSIGKRHIKDLRNDLFIHFHRLVSEIQPKFFVAENVPGILDERYDSIRLIARELVSSDYKLFEPVKINAKDIGVPTNRTRVFFVGIHRSLPNISLGVDYSDECFHEKITLVRDGLAGLPVNVEIPRDSSRHLWRELEEYKENNYPSKISRLIDGVGHEESIERYIKNREITGNIGTAHSMIVSERFSQLLPGQIDLISRAQRLDPNGFCPTLRAGTGKERGSYQAVRPIHPIQPRVITPREAARMQGFPDWFQFHPTKWHSFRQIGNSVSPIVSEYLMRSIYDSIFFLKKHSKEFVEVTL